MWYRMCACMQFPPTKGVNLWILVLPHSIHLTPRTLLGRNIVSLFPFIFVPIRQLLLCALYVYKIHREIPYSGVRTAQCVRFTGAYAHAHIQLLLSIDLLLFRFGIDQTANFAYLPIPNRSTQWRNLHTRTRTHATFILSHYSSELRALRQYNRYERYQLSVQLMHFMRQISCGVQAPSVADTIASKS